MAPKIITVIGSLNTDLVTVTPRVPGGGETLTASSFSTGPGGKGANQAVACGRLSRSKPLEGSPTPSSDVLVNMIGAVGADEFGPSLISSLQDSSINTSSIRTISGQTTGVAVILVEETTGENRILLNPGANHSLQPSDFLTAASLGDPLPDLLVLQLEIPLETVLQILKTAKEAGVHVLLNPAPAVPLPDSAYPSITHLIVNESEGAILTGRRIDEVEEENFNWNLVSDEFIKKGVSNVIVTLGSKGAFFATKNGHSGHVPAEIVKKVVDTTAAGDTFVGAYAVEVLRWGREELEGKFKAMENAVKWACTAAARTVEKQGAQSAIPWANEV